MSGYETINILDLMESVGEDAVKSILSDFICVKNPEIENFVKNNAIEFAKKKMSITYLVVDSDTNIQAIFTLTHKALELRNDVLSGTARKKVQRFAQLDESTNSFVVSAFLIAQFGKNEAIEQGSISGDELMDMTFKILFGVQHDIGGSVVYLECEEKEKLLNFYSSEPNRFMQFGERNSEQDDTKYIQMFRFM